MNIKTNFKWLYFDFSSSDQFILSCITNIDRLFMYSVGLIVSLVVLIFMHIYGEQDARVLMVLGNMSNTCRGVAQCGTMCQIKHES